MKIGRSLEKRIENPLFDVIDDINSEYEKYRFLQSNEVYFNKKKIENQLFYNLFDSILMTLYENW